MPKRLDQTDASLDEGARILRAVVRPYPAKVAGIPVGLQYEMNTGRMHFEWLTPLQLKGSLSKSSPNSQDPYNLYLTIKSNETLIFYPSMLARGRKLIVEGLKDGDSYRYDEDSQTIFITTQDNSSGAMHSATVRLDPPLQSLFPINTFMSDYGLRVYGVIAFLVALIAYFVAS